MRISWLEPRVIRLTRAALIEQHPDWADHFTPGFQPPPPPAGFDRDRWPRVAEHVARAERVSQEIREHGLEAALSWFRGSGHAIELATLIAAAVQNDSLEFELLEEMLACDVDDLVVYGPFLELLQRYRTTRAEQAMVVYEQLCGAFRAKSSDQRHWAERVDAVRDGLASFYVSCGRYEQGHQMFCERHEEDTRGMLVALAASRSFLAAGALGWAIQWLGAGAERADDLERPQLAAKLREKQAALRRRQS